MSGETILLVEDNDAVAMGLRYALEREGFTVCRAATASEAREQALGTAFQLAILDVRLPDGSGFDLCQEFRTSGVVQPILILTARDETVDKVVGLELGADDYVTKPFELQELLARIRSLLRRSHGNLARGARSRVNIGDLSMDLSSQQVRRGGQRIHLTPTEFRLLAFLAENQGKAISRETIFEQVWGHAAPYEDLRTVDVHIRNLRRKVEPNPSRPQLVVTVRGVGYMLGSRQPGFGSTSG